MFDLDLLRSFVSVVDTGGFTRAGEQVNRTQSTISQQIRRLEEAVGKPLFQRDRRAVHLTEAGETLIGYARRMLMLAGEARDALGQGPAPAIIRLGIPEDFAINALTGVIASFALTRPQVRMEVRCDLSVNLRDGLSRGLFDVILAKREPNAGPAFACWPEHLVWTAGRDTSAIDEADPLPLVTFLPGCLYRDRAIRALEAIGRRWRIAYESPNLMGVQAAIAGGLGIGLLEAATLRDDHRALDRTIGLPPIPPTELALAVRDGAPALALSLAHTITDFCNNDRSLRAA